MDSQAEYLRADNNTLFRSAICMRSHHHAKTYPEVASKKTDVEECSRGHSQYDGHRRVKPCQEKRVSSHVPSNFGVPSCVLECSSIENGGLHSDDEHCPPCQLADDFVQRLLAHKKLLRYVGKTITSGAQQSEQISLDRIRCLPTVGSSDVVRCDQDSQTPTADENAHILEDVIADLKEDERNCNDYGNSPEVDELCRKDGCVLVGEDCKVVAFNIEEC